MSRVVPVVAGFLAGLIPLAVMWEFAWFDVSHGFVPILYVLIFLMTCGLSYVWSDRWIATTIAAIIPAVAIWGAVAAFALNNHPMGMAALDTRFIHRFIALFIVSGTLGGFIGGHTTEYDVLTRQKDKNAQSDADDWNKFE